MAPHSSLFTTAERNLIRTEFMIRFGQPPLVADGISLRTWHSGPQAGQPKIPKAIASLLERDLVKVGPGTYGRPHAFFTPAGLEALRAMAQDQRALNPQQYAHVRQELGIETGDQDEAGDA